MSAAGGMSHTPGEATVAELLATWASQAGLSATIAPFAGDAATPLAERFAKKPFLMAPMAGVTDAAYRLMARAGGAALAYTEMVSVAGIHFRGEKTWELVYPHAEEPDIAVQLFGSDPEQFREASAAVAERLGSKLALIDINMACPVPKVTRKGEGSALLDEPCRAAQIVKACLAEVSVPVTVKIRKGRRTGEAEVAPEFARAMEAAGAAAVAVHGRTASQLYRGEADWGCVRRVVEAVTIPVIGSGDVRSASDAYAMRAQTGCAAVMVARGSYGNPWIFDAAQALEAGKEPHQPSFDERLAAFACHVLLLFATGGHMARARSLAGWFVHGMPHAAVWRDRAMHCVTVDDYLALVAELKARVASEALESHDC